MESKNESQHTSNDSVRDTENDKQPLLLQKMMQDKIRAQMGVKIKTIYLTKHEHYQEKIEITSVEDTKQFDFNEIGKRLEIPNDAGAATKSKMYKEAYDDLSGGFFDAEGELEFGEAENKNYYQIFKDYVFKVLQYVVIVWILYSYLESLGTEKSQSLHYEQMDYLNYSMSDLAKLVPVHQFVSFNTVSVKDRIKCKIYGDEEQCKLFQELRCTYKGTDTENYEECMIQVNEGLQQNATQFCENHYQDFTIWKDNQGPTKIMYYLRMHNCYEMSGVPKGRAYCLDYFLHEDSWSFSNLYQCYTKYSVDFAKEFCDNNFPDNKYLLMQCYGQRDVPKGEEFCLSLDEDPALVLVCYESIPLFNFNYCSLKHEQGSQEYISCLRFKAMLVLDRAFCDSQYPGEDKVAFNERYQCYRDIELPGLLTKDREYCEQTNLFDTAKKYKCIDALIVDKVDYICEEENESGDAQCSRKNVISQMRVDGVKSLKGPDYCQFRYPWLDDYEQLNQCLEEEGIPKEYLSNYCVQQDEYRQVQSKKSGGEYDVTAKYECLRQYGIPYEANECAIYMAMPRNQNFVQRTLKNEQISGYVASKNLRLGVENYEYEALDEGENLITTKKNPLIGSLNYAEGYEVWILENEFESFVKYKYNLDLTRSFGQFLFTKLGYQSKDALKDYAQKINREKILFENPLLNLEDVSVQAVIEVVDVDTEKSRRIAEEISYVFLTLYDTVSLSKVLTELDDLFSSKIYPTRSSFIYEIKEELDLSSNSYNVSLRSSGSPLFNGLFKEYQTWLESYREVLELRMNMEVFVTLIFDMTLQHPVLDAIAWKYNSDLYTTSRFVGEIYAEIMAQSNSTLLEFENGLKMKPIYSQFMKEWGEILSMTPEEMEKDGLTNQNLISTIIQELQIPLMIEQARNRTYHTSESVELLFEALKNTQTASKLYQEFYSGESKIYDQLLDDLVYSQGRNAKFFDKIDILIQQKTMSSVINDIFSVLATPMSQDIDQKASEKLVNFEESSKYLLQNENPYFVALKDLEYTNMFFQLTNQTVYQDDVQAGDLINALSDRMKMGYVFKEYFSELKQTTTRRLQDSSWQLGTWYLEDQNQAVAVVGTYQQRIEYDSNIRFNTYNERQLSVKNAIHEIIGSRLAVLPDLKCHFSGDYSKNPSLMIKFDQEYRVKQVTIFNIQNGARTSNLEDSVIYVGNKVCAGVGPKLPENQYIKFECKDQDMLNVFSKNYNPNFSGMSGSFLKIQSNTPGVLVLCDIQIEIETVDLELEKMIQETLDQCKVLQDSCIPLFTDPLQFENLQNCNQNFGLPKSSDYCLKQLSVSDERFFYPLKTKYECLTKVSSEAVECLSLYYDYQIQNCLSLYESQYEKIGFIEGVYTNLTQNIAEIIEEVIIVEVLTEEVEVQEAKKIELKIESSDVSTFLCENSNMVFQTNPWDQESQITMKCEAFEMGQESFVHFYLADFESGLDFVINKTDSNRQQLKLNFEENLSLMNIEQNRMFLRYQDPQDDQVDVPSIQGGDQYQEFLQGEATLLLYESFPTVIGHTHTQDTTIVGVPQRNISTSVAKKDAFTVWHWPIFYTDVDFDTLLYTPEPSVRLSMAGASTHLISLKFDFFKKTFEYSFHSLYDLFSDLGGISGLAEEGLERFGMLFLIGWMVTFAMNIKKQTKAQNTEFIIREYSIKLEGYKGALESMEETPETKEDLKVVNQMLADQAQGEQVEGDQAEGDQEGDQNEGGQFDTEVLLNLEQKYGKLAAKLQHDYFYESVEFEKNYRLQKEARSVIQLAESAKRNISFAGIFFAEDRALTCEQQVTYLMTKADVLFMKMDEDQHTMLHATQAMGQESQQMIENLVEIEARIAIRNEKPPEDSEEEQVKLSSVIPIFSLEIKRILPTILSFQRFKASLFHHIPYVTGSDIKCFKVLLTSLVKSKYLALFLLKKPMPIPEGFKKQEPTPNRKSRSFAYKLQKKDNNGDEDGPLISSRSPSKKRNAHRSNSHSRNRSYAYKFRKNSSSNAVSPRGNFTKSQPQDSIKLNNYQSQESTKLNYFQSHYQKFSNQQSLESSSKSIKLNNQQQQESINYNNYQSQGQMKQIKLNNQEIKDLISYNFKNTHMVKEQQMKTRGHRSRVQLRQTDNVYERGLVRAFSK